MLRIMIMCLLGFSGIFFEAFGIPASMEETGLTKIMQMTAETGGISPKLKRNGIHSGLPCPPSYSHSGMYIPPAATYSGHYQVQAYKKPTIIIPSYQHVMPKVESIGYQKPVPQKMVYQIIQKQPAYNVQPIVKQQVQYIQQPSYTPIVNEHPISYVKQNVQPAAVQVIQPVKTYVKKIDSYENHPPILPSVQPVLIQKSIEKPVIHMQSYHHSPLFQPISYYHPKPMNHYSKPIYLPAAHMNKFQYDHSNIIYQKPNPIIKQPPIVKFPVVKPLIDCGKMHVQYPQISYVKIPQPIEQKVYHQPMLQYAAKYHQSVQQPMIHFVQKFHQPIIQQPIVHFAPKIHQSAPVVQYLPKIHQPVEQNFMIQHPQPITVYGNAEHHSKIITANQPCHK